MEYLKTLLGSESSERILIFILARGSGYPRGIAKFYTSYLFTIQKQMERLEAGYVLSSKTVGRTRVYTFNPRYPFLKELKALLQKAFSFYPEQLQKELTMDRRRPRRSGKPL
jgi:hypothetical protein